MLFPRLLAGLMRAAGPGGSNKLKSVAELDPKLLAKARKLATGVGTAAGAFGSLVGVGGGVLIGPVILNACPAIPQRVISGTSLAAVATTGATAGAVYWSSDCVDARSALVLAAAAVITAPLGAKMTHRVDCQRLRMALGYWLYFVAPMVPLKAYIFSQSEQDAPPQQQQDKHDAQQQQPQQSKPLIASAAPLALLARPASPPPVAAAAAAASPDITSSSGGGGFASKLLQQLQQQPTATDAALAATGSLAGFASGMLGIGGGTVVTPLLALATGAPQQVVLGTSLVAMVVPSVVGLAQHQRLGNVDWRMAAALAVGTSVGSYVGSNFAVNAPAGVLEGLFAAGMLLLGRRTLVAAGTGVPKA